MGNLVPTWRISSEHLEILEGVLYRHAEQLETIHGVIRKKHLTEFLVERKSFHEYGDAKAFVMKSITKAKAQNRVYEVLIYKYNMDTEWTYCISNADEACALSCAKKLYSLNGFFSRDTLLDHLKLSVNPSMTTNDMSHLVGRVISTALEVGCFYQEVAYRLKCPVVHMPEPCPSEDFEEFSSPATCSSDIVNLNTCY